MQLNRVFSVSLLSAAALTASAQLVTLPLWPNGVPEKTEIIGPEKDITLPTDHTVGGRKFIHLSNIAEPSLTVYKPKEAIDTGAAVVVFPGGGYRILANDLEGTEVCTWLNSIGVTCVLTKYRVPIKGHFPERTEDLEDAQQAVRLTRSHASDWRIDPKRVGVLGFSAGGHLVITLSNHSDFKGTNVPPSTVDARPNFVFAIYPAYIVDEATLRKVDPALMPSEKTPPTFLLQAENDQYHEESALFYFQALKDAKVNAELHIYGEGGHGYGLRPTDLPVTHWPRLAEDWLHTIQILLDPAK